MKLIIDRQKWLRGEGETKSSLLRGEDGKMCCLGFLGIECGIESERLQDVGAPEDIPRDANESLLEIWKEASFLFVDNIYRSMASVQLMETNDDTSISDQERERRLSDIFSKHGVEVEFIDGIKTEEFAQ
jgi:hypothetical protein